MSARPAKLERCTHSFDLVSTKALPVSYSWIGAPAVLIGSLTIRAKRIYPFFCGEISSTHITYRVAYRVAVTTFVYREASFKTENVCMSIKPDTGRTTFEDFHWNQA
jgi:hypothetical protein